LVPKPDNTLRVCCDFRALNDITENDAMLLPRIDDVLDKLQGATIFSALDMASGYWACNLREEDRPKTAFMTWSHGLLEWVRMPMGLKCSGSTYQRMIMHVMQGILWCALTRQQTAKAKASAPTTTPDPATTSETDPLTKHHKAKTDTPPTFTLPPEIEFDATELDVTTLTGDFKEILMKEQDNDYFALALKPLLLNSELPEHDPITRTARSSPEPIRHYQWDSSA